MIELAVVGIFFLIGVLIYRVLSSPKSDTNANELLHRTIGEQTAKYEALLAAHQELAQQLEIANKIATTSTESYKKVLSQKKASEHRLGIIAENALGLLSDLPYDPKNLHHLGQPLDYVYFSYDEAEGPYITFVEVKSGASKESKRQRQLKNAIKQGKVFYDKLTIDAKGVTIKREVNED